MANPEPLKILKLGVKHWNNWRKKHPEVQPNFRDANLRGALLQGFDLHDADLTDARLGVKVVVTGNGEDISVTQGHTNLTDADLSDAWLHDADLNRAGLWRANLARASLYRTNLSGAFVHEADFTNVAVLETNFSDIDLSEAKGLQTVKHDGPSTVGIDTIYKSKGKIPEVFLRGCGVPDEFIAYIGSMVGRPIEFYSCFISYSTKDQEFADRFYADLQAKGVRCWFAPHDIRGGRKIHEQLDQAIRLHDKTLLILSEHSMASKWVRIELRKSLDRKAQEGKRVLFPGRLVPFEALEKWELIDSTGLNLAEEIRQFFIPDFSNWKDHDSYLKAFQRLVADLKSVREKSQ
jgi:uncharacterized protein YjbI with pentapeptide repeats